MSGLMLGFGEGMHNLFRSPIDVKSPSEASFVIADYYFSVSGNDATGNGSFYAPYQTIAKANALIAASAGSKILAFKGGDTFNTTVSIFINRPNITITSYGVGKAIIRTTADVNAIGIYIDDGVVFGKSVGTLTITNIELYGNGIAGTILSGLDVYADSVAAANYGTVIINNVIAHDYGENGIKVGSFSGTKGYLSVTISNCICYNNGRGISTYAQTGYAHASVTFRSNITYNNPGKGAFPTGLGISIGNAISGLIENCVSYANGGSGAGGGYGVGVYFSSNVVIQNNESYNNTSTGPDGDGFDIDGGCTDCTLQYNYSHGNKGAGYLVYGNANGVNLRPVVRFNISINDGNVVSYGSILIGQENINGVTDAKIYNNSCYQSNANGSCCEVVINGTGNFTNCIISNNVFYSQGGINLVRINNLATVGILLVNNDYFGSTTSVNWLTVNYGTVAAWLAAIVTQEQILGTPKNLGIDPNWKFPSPPPTVNGYVPGLLLRYNLGASNALRSAGLNVNSQYGWAIPANDYYGIAIAAATMPVGASKN